MNISEVKAVTLSVIGVVGGCISSALGGWDTAVEALAIFMAVDFVLGVLCATIFKKSPKTQSGGISSNEMAKGFIKKILKLVIVAVAYRIDLLIGSSFVRDAAVIAFCASELLSIVENAGLMGVPFPKPVLQAIDILQRKSESKTSDNNKT